MRDREDPELQGLFRHLQNADGRKVPDFRALMDRARDEATRAGMELYPGSGRTRSVSRRLAWGGSLLAAAAAAMLLLARPPVTSDSEFVDVVQAFSSDPAGGAWKSPTDGLLELPGGNILKTVPTLGTNRLLMDPGSNPRRNEL